MTPCEEKGYEVGQVFTVVHGITFDEDSTVVLSKDDGSGYPLFDLVDGGCNSSIGIKTKKGAYVSLSFVERIYPPEEEKTKDVEVVCEGKTTVLSRESAKVLGLC